MRKLLDITNSQWILVFMFEEKPNENDDYVYDVMIFVSGLHDLCATANMKSCWECGTI